MMQIADSSPLQGSTTPQRVSEPTSHQCAALLVLSSFVSSDDTISFSVLGMTSTGKSRLLALAAEEVRGSGKKAIVLEPNRRLSNKAKVDAISIYAHMYTGIAKVENGQDPGSEEKKPKIIALGLCEDPEDCVYLVDDAHLLGNSRFNTPDGKQYGSGHLLGDFFDFTKLGENKRKVVFFGDPYQIQRSAKDESALLGEFQKQRNLRHQHLELEQVIDTTCASSKLTNAERLVKCIRSKRFAELDLIFDGSFRLSEKHSAATQMMEHFRSDPLSVWYLAETHAKVNALTRWVRERLHVKNHLDNIEPGDLIEIYVSPDDRGPIGLDGYRHVGGRQWVVRIGERSEYSQPLKWATENPVRFHSISCTIGGLNETKIELFEEFLVAAKPELEKEVAVAESVWRLKPRNERDDTPREVAMNGSAENPPRPEFVYARFGYASTVHHAQGMSEPICYINCDVAAGNHSEAYFRWLYSAMTVSEREVVLINYTPIHPFDSATWNIGSVTVAKDIAVGGGWRFEANGVVLEQDQKQKLPPGLDKSRDILKSSAILFRISKAVENFHWRIVSAECFPYQEQYLLEGPKGERCKMRVPYTGENIVTAIHVGDPAFWSLLAATATEILMTASYSPEASSLRGSLRLRCEKMGWYAVSIVETSYRLVATLVRQPDERVQVEINFDKQGLASSLRPLQVSDLGLLDEIKKIFL